MRPRHRNGLASVDLAEGLPLAARRQRNPQQWMRPDTT
jgi:hypothetical protein